MQRRPKLAKSELEVVRIVWMLGNGTVRQVLEALPNDRDLDFKTVQTYLRRLHTKGYLSVVSKGRTLVYKPRVRPRQVIRETVDDMLDRLFDGQVLPLFDLLVNDRGVSADEIRRLHQLLEDCEEQADDESTSGRTD